MRISFLSTHLPSVLALTLGLVLAAAAPAWSGLLRLTNDSRRDQLPQLNNAGQVVWQADEGIFFFDGSGVRQLNEGGFHHSRPRINNAGQVVWEGHPQNLNAGIYFWNGSSLQVLTGENSPSYNPQINDKGQVVWEGSDGNDKQIYLWDGRTIRRLTDAPTEHAEPRINNQGQVIWEADVPISGTTDGPHLGFWDGDSLRVIPSHDVVWRSAQINDRGHVVWASDPNDGRTGPRIFLWDGAAVRQLTPDGTNGTFPQINNRGQVLWKGVGTSRGLYLWDQGAVQRLFDRDVGSAYPQLNEAGQVVWLQSERERYELLMWDGSAIPPLTRRRGGYNIAQRGWLNDRGQVTWIEASDQDGEVYLYTPPAPGSLSLEPAPVVEGTSTTGVVTLPAPAPAGGAVVTLSSANPAVARVPESVTVPAGASEATFPVTTSLVRAPTDVLLSASYGGNTWSVELHVWHAVPATLRFDQSRVIGGQSAATGTLTLDGEAPPGGALITLASDHPDVLVPASVTVPEMATTVTFPVTTRPVPASAAALITASYSGATVSRTLRVTPPPLTTFSLKPVPVTGGVQVGAQIYILGEAPPGGLVVTLSSSHPDIAPVPATVRVEPGARTAWFPIETRPVSGTTLVRLSATFDGITKTAQLVVLAVGLREVIVSTSPVRGGSSSLGAVTLSAPAPIGGVELFLTSDNEAAFPLPRRLVIPAGETVAVFSISTRAVTRATRVEISVYFAGVTQKATLTVVP